MFPHDVDVAIIRSASCVASLFALLVSVSFLARMVCLHPVATSRYKHVINLSSCVLRQYSAVTWPRSSPRCNAVAACTPTPPNIDETGAVAIADKKEGKLSLKDMTYEELESWCIGMGEKESRAMQLWRFMYYDGQWIRGFHETIGKQNGLSKAFADRADQVSTCDAGLHLQHVHTSTDGTRKLLFSIAGEDVAQVETVLIPVVRKKVHSPNKSSVEIVFKRCCCAWLMHKSVLFAERSTRPPHLTTTRVLAACLAPIHRGRNHATHSTHTPCMQCNQVNYDGVQGKTNRVTICVSSQVGCAMGCTFCYTGRSALPLISPVATDGMSDHISGTAAQAHLGNAQPVPICHDDMHALHPHPT